MTNRNTAKQLMRTGVLALALVALVGGCKSGTTSLPDLDEEEDPDDSPRDQGFLLEGYELILA